MRIITGRSCSGKTTMILQEICDKLSLSNDKQILIVPELFSHEYERRLADVTQNRASKSTEVLSFTRLCTRIFSEVCGLSDTVLSSAGRLLVLDDAIYKTASSLNVYRDANKKADILKQILSAIDEFKCYNIDGENLLSKVLDLKAQGETALADKILDLSQIITMYDKLCADNLSDPRDDLTLLASRITQSNSMKNTKIYIDGFNGLTFQEMNIIDKMLEMKLDITVCITCDHEQPEIFVSALKFEKSLLRLAKRHNEKVQTINLEGSLLQRQDDIAKIERDALRSNITPINSDGHSVMIYSATNPLEECEFAASYIIKKMRNGANYDDFVIAARSIDDYTAPLEMAMSRFNIPIFISEKSELMQKPPLALITNAIQTIANGFRYQDFFACLRTGLCNISVEEIDKLENYALTWRIAASAWTKDFTGHPNGYGKTFDETSTQTLAELNEIRSRAVQPFITFANSANECANGMDFSKTLYDFLINIGAEQSIVNRAKIHEDAGRLQLADEYTQLWDILIDAIEQFAWTCEHTPMTLEKFSDLFTLVLSEYDVASIPVSLDRVNCGSLERIGAQPTKHLILLGVNDGLIPKLPTTSGVLTENDRLTLDGLGIELSACGEERMLMEQELLYRALASVSESLIISYHENSADGKETRPSYLIDTIKAMLIGVNVQSASLQISEFKLQSERTSLELACAYISGTKNIVTYSAYEKYKNDDRILNLQNHLQSNKTIISKNNITGLYGKNLSLTASRIDKFYSCQFAFFMEYGVKARARKQAKFDAPEAGTFIHYVLENTINALEKMSNSSENGIKSLTDEQIKLQTKISVRKYIDERLGGLEGKTARFKYLFLRLVKSMESIMDNLIEELKTSDFKPIDYELNFSYNGDLPPVKIEKDDVNANLIGMVDRIDGYEKDGKLYVKIMDYKSGKKAFSLSEVWHGLNLQLILYLNALKENGMERYKQNIDSNIDEIIPAGMLYVPTRHEIIDADREISIDALKQEREKALKRSGLISDDKDVLLAMENGIEKSGRFLPVKISTPKAKKGEEAPPEKITGVISVEKFAKLAMFAQSKLVEMAKILQDGEVLLNPYESPKADYCSWCSFKPACQFDEANGDCKRTLYTVDDQYFWENIEGDAQNGD